MSLAGADDPLAITDADLVARIAAGDVDAPVAELYRRYETWLYRCGLQALGDTGLAQDVVQECFVRLWRNAGQFDPARGSVATYLLVIGRSVAADIRKRPSSRPLEQLDEGHLPPQLDSVDQILSGLMVRDALDSLSPAHRQVLALSVGRPDPIPDRGPARASAGDGEDAGLPCDAGAARRAGPAGLRPYRVAGPGSVVVGTVPDRTTRPGWPGRAALSRVISIVGKSSGSAAVHICTVAVPDAPTVKVPALTRRG